RLTCPHLRGSLTLQRAGVRRRCAAVMKEMSHCRQSVTANPNFVRETKKVRRCLGGGTNLRRNFGRFLSLFSRFLDRMRGGRAYVLGARCGSRRLAMRTPLHTWSRVLAHARALGDERGQIAPLMMVFLTLFMLGSLLVVDVGLMLNERRQAQTAADFAALAA